MKKCENTYIAQQCISMKATIQNFKLGLKMASMKDDGITDKNEEKMIKSRKTLSGYKKHLIPMNMYKKAPVRACAAHGCFYHFFHCFCGYSSREIVLNIFQSGGEKIIFVDHGTK